MTKLTRIQDLIAAISNAPLIDYALMAQILEASNILMESGIVPLLVVYGACVIELERTAKIYGDLRLVIENIHKTHQDKVAIRLAQFEYDEAIRKYKAAKVALDDKLKEMSV